MRSWPVLEIYYDLIPYKWNAVAFEQLEEEDLVKVLLKNRVCYVLPTIDSVKLNRLIFALYLALNTFSGVYF